MKSLRSALVLTFLLAGCSFEVGDYQPRHALEEYRPASPHARIRSVSFGLGNGDKFDGTHIGTKLPETATQAMVWYEFKIGPQGTRVDVRWYMGDEKKPLLVQTERLDGSFGESAWALRTASGNPLPTGRYHVELVENGTVVTTIPFTVGDAS